MRSRGKEDKKPQRFIFEEEVILDLLRRSAGRGEEVSPGEALTLEQTVEVLQRIRSRQRPGSPVSQYLDDRERS
ncbi:MAG: hypothetical protein R6V12_03775 [Candidatus Hydrogenedentota bacterium]